MYVPGSKGAPSFVRLYQYPNFGGPQSALANKSFFKADKVTMLWNKKGIIALCLSCIPPILDLITLFTVWVLHLICMCR